MVMVSSLQMTINRTLVSDIRSFGGPAVELLAPKHGVFFVILQQFTIFMHGELFTIRLLKSMAENIYIFLLTVFFLLYILVTSGHLCRTPSAAITSRGDQVLLKEVMRSLAVLLFSALLQVLEGDLYCKFNTQPGKQRAKNQPTLWFIGPCIKSLPH